MATRARAGEHRKATFTLPAEVLDAMRHLVDEGVSPSQSAFVVEALQKEIRSWRLEQLRAEFRQAASDPDFLKDIDDSVRDFAVADAETARMIP